MSELTMYAAAKKVNGWLKEDGVQKTLPPQMFYGYAGKGYIDSYESPQTGKICTTETALRTWYDEKYRAPKKSAKQEETVAEFDGTVGEWA